MADERYFTHEDPEPGLSAEELAKLPADQQSEYIKAWFGRYFEDPVQEMPYIGREGGYQYIHGGPYDAEEEIRGEFEGVLSEEAIEAAVEDLTSDGTFDWAPTSYHPDREGEGRDDERPPTADDLLDQISFGGVEPKFGGEDDLTQRAVVLERLDAIERLLEELVPKPGEMGHNGPPGSITVDQVAEITQAIGEVKIQLAEPTPDLEAVAKAATVLEHLGRWLWEKFDKGVEAAVTAIGAAAGTGLVAAGAAYATGHGDALLDAVELATASLVHWLTIVI
jgi:hypothetical protein